MENQKPNGIAQAEDFKRAFEAREPGTRLVLPTCGLPVRARRLSPLRVLLLAKRLERLEGLEETVRNTQFAEILLEVIQEVLIEPRLALSPGPREIDPNWVPLADGRFLFDWGMGLIVDDGTRLDDFFRRGGAPATAAAGADRGNLQRAPERAGESDGRDGIAV
jgi:hypothetical protein